jgi:hypothetical protein
MNRVSALLGLVSEHIQQSGAGTASWMHVFRILEFGSLLLILNYLLTHGAESFLRSRQLCSHSKNFSPFYGTREFNAVFTRVLHWSLSWVISIQSTPSRPNSLRSTLILSTQLAWKKKSWRYRQNIPPKRRLTFKRLHGVISQKIELSITTAVRT